MLRILVTGSRLWSDVPLLTGVLDEQARSHDHMTLVHGRCDPRKTDGDRILWGGIDRIPWNVAVAIKTRTEVAPWRK